MVEEKIKSFLRHRLGLVIFAILSVVATMNLYNLVALFGIDENRVQNYILLFTLLALFWYAWETGRMKNEMVAQNELSLKPILILFVRKCSSDHEYCIKPSSSADNFTLKVRNVGRGPAANLQVRSDRFVVERYRNNTLAPEPQGDEQSFKIKRKDGADVQSYDELNGVEFELSAQNFAEPSNRYYFVYKVVDVVRQEVEFVG